MRGFESLILCHKKQIPIRVSAFYFAEVRDSNQSKCNTPGACCWPGRGPATPLFLPHRAKMQIESLIRPSSGIPSKKPAARPHGIGTRIFVPPQKAPGFPTSRVLFSCSFSGQPGYSGITTQVLISKVHPLSAGSPGRCAPVLFSASGCRSDMPLPQG